MDRLWGIDPDQTDALFAIQDERITVDDPDNLARFRALSLERAQVGPARAGRNTYRSGWFSGKGPCILPRQEVAQIG